MLTWFVLVGVWPWILLPVVVEASSVGTESVNGLIDHHRRLARCSCDSRFGLPLRPEPRSCGRLASMARWAIRLARLHMFASTIALGRNPRTE